MNAVRLSQRSWHVKFTDEMQQNQELSTPSRSIACTDHRQTYSSHETPEFQRQNRDFATAVMAPGKPVERVESPYFNHFKNLESLGNPRPSGRAALALMKLWAD